MTAEPCTNHRDADEQRTIPRVYTQYSVTLHLSCAHGIARVKKKVKANMKIHEYQAKEILRQYGVPTPRGSACFSVDEAEVVARNLGGAVWVVKAQIHAGGGGEGWC